MVKKGLVVAFCAVWCLLIVGPAQAAFQITELKGLGGSSEALSINDLGQVVGASSIYDYACPWAVLWNADGSVVDLGASNSKGLSSKATGININGMVTGTRALKATSCDSGIFRAFVIVPETRTDKYGTTSTIWHRDLDGNGINDLMIDLPSDTSVSSFATGINDAGQISGYMQGPDGRTIAFVVNPIDKDGDGRPESWSGLKLESDYYLSVAYGINNKGEVVGRLSDEKVSFGVVWAAATGKIVRRSHVIGRDIDDSGVIAGSYLDIASLETSDAMVQLGTLGGKISTATALNNAGQVVGRSLNSLEVPDSWRAFLWQGDQLSDLGALGNGTSEANSINKNGQIVGKSQAPGDLTRAVLWTEIKTPVEQVETITNDLNTLVQGGSIAPADATSLAAPLAAATVKLTQGNTTAACNALNAFVNQTNAKVKSGRLTPEQGKALADAAAGVTACK